MTPFVSPALVALGPFIVPIFILIFAALLCLAIWLIDRGGIVCTGLGALIIAGLCLQLAPLVLVL